MPKPHLKPGFSNTEALLIATFLDGMHKWRPDLHYPESHSDMQGGMRAILRMFRVTIREEPLTNEDLEDEE